MIVARLFCNVDEMQNSEEGGTWLSVLKGMQTLLAEAEYEQVRVLRYVSGLSETAPTLSRARCVLR